MQGFNFVALPAANKAEAILAMRTLLSGNPPTVINQECRKVARDQATSVTDRVYLFSDGSRLDKERWV